MDKIGDCIHIANPNDYWWESGDDWPTYPNVVRKPKPFWKYCYLVTLSEFAPVVFVNADNEQDALDYAIDFCEEMGWIGLLLSIEDENELAQDAIKDGKSEFAYLEEHTHGGNHGRYLSSLNIHIEKVR